MSIWFRLTVYPILWLVSILPFPLLYGFSNFLRFMVYNVIGYRKKIVRQNLANAFPDKSEKERLVIEKKYYKHLADLILETIKGMTITGPTLKKHLFLSNPEVTQGLYDRKQSAVIVMSHCGNWEWVCSVAQITVPQFAQCIYKSLTNKNWDAWLFFVRSRFGTLTFPLEKTMRILKQNSDKTCVTAIIGDQNPHNTQNVHWTTFLNQETCFMMGSEKIARKLNQSVYYMAVKKMRRGYYECELQLMCENAAETKEGEISEMVARFTERDIVSQPENWLWSHRRWKHRREND